MAVCSTVFLVIVVLVAQVECASIARPEQLHHNHLESPVTTDDLDVPKTAHDEENNPVTLGKQVKLKQDESQDPNEAAVNLAASDSVLTNSHTITSEDFAAKTGASSLQAPDTAVAEEENQEHSNVAEPNNESNGEEETGSKSGEESAATPVDETKPSDSDSSSYITETTNEENKDDTSVTPGADTQDNLSGVDSSSTDEPVITDEVPTTTDDKRYDLPLKDLSQTICDEVKVYSNEVAMIWEKKERGAAWTLEAESVLKDYVDKIGIAQSANNSLCVKKDLQNHESRSKALQDVIESCRKDIKRENWNKLQAKTVKVLNEIKDIGEEAASLIEKLSTDDPEYSTKKSDIENEAKTKLIQLYSKDLKDKFKKLKDAAVKGDDEEYVKCLDDKPEKGMIVDTLNDIMRIKNNCVG